MDGSRDNRRDDDKFRNNYIYKTTGKLPPMLEQRLRVMQEIGGIVTYDNILTTAIQRCRNNAPQVSKSLYGTWSQHISTIGKVFDEFRLIMDQLQLSQDDKNRLAGELNKQYGSGSDGNYMS